MNLQYENNGYIPVLHIGKHLIDYTGGVRDDPSLSKKPRIARAPSCPIFFGSRSVDLLLGRPNRPPACPHNLPRQGHPRLRCRWHRNSAPDRPVRL